MNLPALPDIILRNILQYCSLTDLKNLSETNKKLNWFCRTQKLNSFRPFKELSDQLIGIDMYPEQYLPKLRKDNYLTAGSVWKNVIFYLSINYNDPLQKLILRNYVPSNILVSIIGMTEVNIGMLNKSIQMVDSPWTNLSCPRHVSHNLKYLNISEQFYIPNHIDFSGKSLEVLHMNMSNLSNLTFNFSRTLKVVSIFGCTGITSLKGFEHIEKLNMDYCDQITSIEPLVSVKELSMRHCNRIEDVSSIKKCEKLDISHTQISDVSMLKNLRSVMLTGLEKITFNVLRHDIIYLR